MRIEVIQSIGLGREFSPWIFAFFMLEASGAVFQGFASTWRKTGVSTSGQPNSGRKDGSMLHLLYLSFPKWGFSCGLKEAENRSIRQQHQLMRTTEDGSPLWDREGPRGFVSSGLLQNAGRDRHLQAPGWQKGPCWFWKLTIGEQNP